MSFTSSCGMFADLFCRSASTMRFPATGMSSDYLPMPLARCSLQDPVVVTLKTSGNCPCPRATEGIRYFLATPRLRSLLALNLAADIRAITAR
jgi:hypothetical protein